MKDEIRQKKAALLSAIKQAKTQSPIELADAYSDYAYFIETSLNDIEGAKRFYLKAIELAPTDALCLSRYATYLARNMPDSDAPEQYFLRAIAAEPLQADCLGGYADYLASNKQDIATAHNYYQKAIAADSRSDSQKHQYRQT